MASSEGSEPAPRELRPALGGMDVGYQDRAWGMGSAGGGGDREMIYYYYFHRLLLPILCHFYMKN
jgi:hypothetical protein